jgi:hypothetical protein
VAAAGYVHLVAAADIAPASQDLDFRHRSSPRRAA